MVTKELKIAIGASVGIIGVMIYKTIKRDVESHYKAVVDKHMLEVKDPAVVSLEQQFKITENAAKELKEKENYEIQKRVNEFKNGIGYDDKINEYKHAVEEGVDRFKEAINADEEIEAIKSELNDKINTYKKEKSYDRVIDSYKRSITTAQSTYEHEKNMAKVFTDEEAAKAVKKIAKAKRNDVVETAKADMEAFENEFKEFKKDATSNANERINKINAQVSSERARLKKENDLKIEKLRNLLRGTSENIREDVTSKRTEDTLAVYKKYDEMKVELDKAHEKEKKLRETIEMTMTSKEKFALYLHHNGWTKLKVELVGMIPISIVFYYTSKYLAWLKEFGKLVEKGVDVGVE